MASGDGIFKRGNWAPVQASASTADGVVNASASTDISTAIPAEQNYFYLDFRSVVTGTVNGGALNVYKRPENSPIPSGTYEQIFVGNMIPDTQASTYELRGVVNDDPADRYYVQNATGGTITLDLQVRGRTTLVEV